MESAGVEGAQKGGGATAQVVGCLVLRHGAVRQHGHVQLSPLQAAKDLRGQKQAEASLNIACILFRSSLERGQIKRGGPHSLMFINRGALDTIKVESHWCGLP